MKTTHLCCAVLSILVMGCVTDEALDGEHDIALPDGKADGSGYTDCELDAVVAWLNGGATAADLSAAGVNSQAGTEIIAHRDGLDGVAGTGDDNTFDDIAEVDAVPYVGPITMSQLVAAVSNRCPTDQPNGCTWDDWTIDPFADGVAHSTMLIDSAGTVHVSYTATGDDDLRYAHLCN